MKISKISAPNLETAWKRARKETRTTNQVVTNVKHDHDFKYRSGAEYIVTTRKRK